MKGSLLLCRAQIKKRKLQNILVTLVLFLACFLFATSVSVIKNNEDLYSKMHGELNGAHQILQLQNGIYNAGEIQKWWAGQKGVTVSPIMSYITVSEISKQAGSKIINYIAYMMKTPGLPFDIDRLIMTDGIERRQPAKGHIWIPTTFALSHDVHVGDELRFSKQDKVFCLKVEAIVIDISYCAPFSTNGRFWMNPGDFEGIKKSTPGNQSMISLRFEDYEQNQRYWDRFEEDFKAPYLESITGFESLSSFYLVTNKLISSIMFFLAAVMFLIALFAIEHIISDSMITNYMTIGIIKSFGFTNQKVMFTYILQYLMLSLAALIPGVAASYFLSRWIVMNSFIYLNSQQLLAGFEYMPVAVGIMVLMPFTVVLLVRVFTRKAGNIKPVQAIRYGMDERSASKLAIKTTGTNCKRLEFERFPLTVQLALRSIFRNRQSTCIIIVISTLTISVLVFCSIFFTSILNIQEAINEWGYDTSDLVITAKNEKSIDSGLVSDILKNMKNVENYSSYSDVNAIVEKSDKVPSMGIVISVVDGSYDEIGFTNLEGRNPENKNEISVGINIAKKYNKTIGDSISIYIKGKKATFTITGIYQAIANMAYSARITSDTISRLHEQTDIEVVFVNLKDHDEGKSFAKQFNNRYMNTLNAVPSEELVAGVISEATSVISLPIIIMILIFLIVIFVLIYSLISIMTKKHQMTYGIYKSLGMTSVKIRRTIALSVLIISFVSMWGGIAAGTLFIPRLLNIVLGNYGITNMPFVYSLTGISGVALAGVLCAAAGAYAASGNIKTTSPRILTME